MADKVKLYPAAIGPIKLTERDRLLIWSPVEIYRVGHSRVFEVEFLWRWKWPYTVGSYTHVQFAQFGPFDFRRLPKWRKSPADTEPLTDVAQRTKRVETG